MMDITIAIAMHKPYSHPNDSIYLPVHVGADLHPEVLPEITQDNTGDNISSQNPYFSELTALYWLWKNCDSDYKGLVHYRRYFASKKLSKRLSKDCFDRVLGRAELEEMLKECEILLPRKRHYIIETIGSHYAHTMHAEHLDLTRQLLQEMAPDYVAEWDKLMKRRSAYVFNMMIMDKKDFDTYCAWVFPILFEMVKRLDPSQYSPFHARYPGRISERLLNVWIAKNHKKVKTIPTVYTEPVNWWKKGESFVAAKIYKKEYEESF